MPAAAKPAKSQPLFVPLSPAQAVPPAGPAPDGSGPGPRDLPASWWHSIEESVLLLTAPPVQRALAEAGLPSTDRLSRCPRCGCLLGEQELEPVCEVCRTSPPTWAALVTLGSYADPLSGIVRQTKERPWPELGLAAGKILGEQVRIRLASAGLKDALVIVIPVPTSRVRVVLRGIDHPVTIAKGLMRGLAPQKRQAIGLTSVLGQILARRWRWKQAALSAWRRKENVTGSMTTLRRARIPVFGVLSRLARQIEVARKAGKPVVALVVDDVVTTGATAREAIRAARSAFAKKRLGVRIWWVASVSRVEKPSE